jgi:hypothetical protein
MSRNLTNEQYNFLTDVCKPNPAALQKDIKRLTFGMENAKAII